MINAQTKHSKGKPFIQEGPPLLTSLSLAQRKKKRDILGLPKSSIFYKQIKTSMGSTSF
jgi:hypothetical protein